MCEQDMTDPTSHMVETVCTVPGLAILTLSQAQQFSNFMRFCVVRTQVSDAEYSCAEDKQSTDQHEVKGILGTGGMKIGMRESHLEVWKNGKLKVSQAGAKHSYPCSQGPGA